MKKEIYDITTAFITDKDVKISIFNIGNDIGYTFTKYGLADYPYCLTIFAIGKAPHKINPHIYETNHKRKYYGKINVKRGTAASTGDGTRILFEYTTKNEVGSALDNTQNNIKRFFTRIQSPEFFNIVNMAEKRILNKLPTTNNSAQLLNMINSLKEKQK